MSMEKQDYERLAKLETEIEGLRGILIKMDAKLDTYAENFVPRSEVNEMFRSRDQDIQEIREDLKELKNEIKNDNRSNKALLPAWGAVVVALGTMVATLI